MRKKTMKSVFFNRLLIGIVMLVGQQANATEYQTYYLDSINSGDKISYCPGVDSLKFIPETGANVMIWMYNGYQDTIYTDTLVLYNGFEGFLHCQGSGVTVQELYVSPFMVRVFGNKSIVCGGTAQLQVESDFSGPGVLTYAWAPATGLNNSTISNPAATPTANTNYEVTVSKPDGCQVKNNISITVNPLELYAGEDITITCGNSAQCNLSSNYSGTGELTYAWSPGTGLNNSAIANPTSAVTENTIYQVTVSTPNGCQATDYITVMVDPFIVNAGEDKTVACGSSVQLDEISSNYSGTISLTYLWTPATGLNDATISNPVSTTSETTNYTVTVTTPNGCQANDNVTVTPGAMGRPDICMVSVDNSNKNIIIWDKPVTSFVDSFYIYKETGITNDYRKIGAVAYEDVSSFTDNSSNARIQSNKYKISIFDKCGFESDKSQYHKTIHLSINKGQGNVWNLIWESYDGFPVSSYYIYRGTYINNLELIGTSPADNTQYSDILAPDGYVYYQIEIYGFTVCNAEKKASGNLKATSYSTSRSNIATNNPSAISDNMDDSEIIDLYPNPSDDQITIEVKTGGFTHGIAEIIDMSGQLVKREALYTHKTYLNIGELKTGIYLVNIITDKGIAKRKLLKQ